MGEYYSTETKITTNFDMQAHSKGRDIKLVFEEDLGAALSWACEQDSDSDAVHHTGAAQIVRQHLLDIHKSFNGLFERNCQEDSVPTLLLTLVGAPIITITEKTITSK